MVKCSVCGRKLTNPKHAAAGVGPVCSTKRAKMGAAAAQADEAKAEAMPLPGCDQPEPPRDDARAFFKGINARAV